MIRALAVATWMFLTLPAVASATAPQQYLLRHPKREHCKVHYLKRTVVIKKHANGRTLKVSETLCLLVKSPPTSTTPAATPPAAASPPVALGAAPTTPATPPPSPSPEPAPTKPSGPLATTTTLTLSPPEECKLESLGMFGSNDWCLYAVSASIVGADGTPVTTPTPAFVFANPGEPATEWIVSGTDAVRLEVSVGRVQSTVATTVSVPGVGIIGEAPGEADWSIFATYAGSSTWAASSSATQTVGP